MSKHHILKSDPTSFHQSWKGDKPFEIRLDDRYFMVNDTVQLQETVFSGEEMKIAGKPLAYTGFELFGTIKYIMRGPIYGLEKGWVVMTIEFTKWQSRYER